MSRPSIYDSDEFLLWGIREVARGALNYDKPIGPQTPVVALFEVQAKPDFGDERFEDFFCGLRNCFDSSGFLDEILTVPGGLKTEDDVARWTSNEGSRITVADLMRLIRAQSPQLSFAPLPLAGAPGCDAAGWFLGIRDLVRNVDPKAPEFAPSHPITSVLRGTRLVHVLRRLTIYSRFRFHFQTTRSYNAGLFLRGVAICTALGCLVLEMQQPGMGWLMFGILWAIKSFGIGNLLVNWGTPLPAEITTFADLSRWLAALSAGCDDATSGTQIAAG